MNYQRVIPRDLFNEANLLKCIGQLWLKLETMNLPNVAIEHDGSAFDVHQDPNDGSIALVNVELVVRGDVHGLWRPLNSREPWPLYVLTVDGEEVAVFDDNGELTPEMLAFLETK